MKTFMLSLPRATVQPAQLEKELRQADLCNKTLVVTETDDGDTVITIKGPDTATIEAINIVVAAHVPQADYGAPPEPPTTQQIKDMTHAQLGNWIATWTVEERKAESDARAAILAASAARGIV